MPARVTIFARKSCAHITAQDIYDGLADTDWHTAAEGEGIDDDEIVDLALSYFRIEGENGYFKLYFRPPAHRPLEIDIFEDSLFSESIAEEIENLDLNRLDRDAIVEHLRECVEIIDIEIGYFQFVEMAPVFAYAVARWLAEICDGWVKDDDDLWWRLDDRNWWLNINADA